MDSINTITPYILFVIGVLSLLYLFLWKWGFFTLPQEKNYPMSVIYLISAFGIFIAVQFFLAPILLVVTLSWWHGEIVGSEYLMSKPQLEGWLGISIITLLAGTFIFYVSEVLPHIQRQVFGRNGCQSFFQSVKDFFVGILSWVITYPPALFVGIVAGVLVSLLFDEPSKEQVAVVQVRKLTEYPYLLSVMVFMVILVVPIIEEMLFRGFLQSWVKQYLGRGWAIIISSIIFALFHYSEKQGVTNYEIFATLFVLSCFLGFLFERRQSLWAPVGLHASFNGISVLMILLGVN